MEMRHGLALAAALALAAGAAGCGDGGADKAISGQDAPAFTTPVTHVPYENGGSDGSGGDGVGRFDPRGGVAAGADSPNPQQLDRGYTPPADEGQGTGPN